MIYNYYGIISFNFDLMVFECYGHFLIAFLNVQLHASIHVVCCFKIFT